MCSLPACLVLPMLVFFFPKLVFSSVGCGRLSEVWRSEPFKRMWSHWTRTSERAHTFLQERSIFVTFGPSIISSSSHHSSRPLKSSITVYIWKLLVRRFCIWGSGTSGAFNNVKISKGLSQLPWYSTFKCSCKNNSNIIMTLTNESALQFCLVILQI